MRLRITAAILFACLAAVPVLLSVSGASGARLPQPPTGFFGIAPQTPLTEEDARYMRAGGIESIRVPVAWSEVQPTATKRTAASNA